MIVLIVAAALGYLWGITGVQIVDTGPWQLHASYQGYYVQAVADAYAENNDAALAADRLSFLCQADGGLDRAFDEAAARYASAPQRIANLDQLRTLRPNIQQNTGVSVCNTQPQGAPVPSIVPLVILILMGLAIAGVGVMRMIRVSEGEQIEPVDIGGPAVVGAPLGAAPGTSAAATMPGATAPAPTPERGRATLPKLPGLPGRKRPEEAQETARSAASQGAALSRQAEKTDFQAIGTEPPLVQFMTTYLHGDDLYDDSFSIETPSGEFLGETGVGISETLTTTEAKNVTAFEVWLFDKNDIRTVTKVLMSDHAFNDDALRARLAPKGEAVQAEPGKRVTLETASLRVQARIVDLSYTGGPLPPNGAFDRITIELAAWKKDAQSGGGAPGGMAASSRANLPGAPSGGGTPPSGSPPISG
jgi:hypothetical protein